MARLRPLVVIAWLVAGAVAPVEAVPATYSGQITSGSSGGSAWSYGYQVGGPTLFALDTAGGFTYTYDDVTGNGLDGGDVLAVKATVGILDAAGSLGTLTLTGSLTVGGATDGYHTDALDGTLVYSVAFSGAPGQSVTPALGAGDTLTGSLAVTGGILGYGPGQPDLRFSFHGDGGASAHNGLPGGVALGVGVGVSGVPTDCSEVPPPPGCGPPPGVSEAPSLALLGAGLVTLAIVARRRRG